jgi:hypothetical protein
MKRVFLTLLGSALVMSMLAVPGGAAQEATPAIDPADFSPVVTNPFFPLASVPSRVYEGEETEEDSGETVHTRVEETVLAETTVVAGVEVTAVEVKEYADDELIELTHDYYAQHRDGTVYYFGEDVDNYEDGQVVGHEGAWLAGEGENQPGIFMPANPEVGQTFEQERAPGIAEDRSTVVAGDQSITTPAGDFGGCIRTEDFAPLDNVTEHKYYCPDIGLVREEFDEGFLDLISYETEDMATPSAA